MILRLLTLVLLLATLAGCDEPAADPSTATAGQDTERVLAPEDFDRRGSLTEEMRIDGQEADLVPIIPAIGGRVAVADDGSMAVVQGQDQSIRFFASDGAPLGRIGGQGEGPGEFVGLSYAGWLADSLWIYDTRLERTTILTPERELARTMRMPPEARPAPADVGRIPGSTFVHYFGPRSDGSSIGMVFPMGDDLPEEFQYTTVFANVSADGTIEELLSVVKGGDHYLRDGRGASMSVPFDADPVMDISRDGRVVASATAGVGGDSTRSLLTMVGAEGDTLASVVFSIDRTTVPAARKDSVYALAIRQARGISTEMGRLMMDRASHPAYHPPLEQLIVGRDSSVWVGLGWRDGVHPYLVLTADGAPVGRVHLNDRSRIAEAERGQIWVVERDEYDVESLVRYRVEWEDR